MNVAAIYSRVSTRDQADSGTSLDTQERACVDRATALGYRVHPDFVIREDWTGTDLERPGLRKLAEGAGRGAFDTVMVFTLDRLYRPKESGDEWRVFQAIDGLRQKGVSVEFVDASLPTSGPLAGVIGFLRSWMAGQERQAIIERTSRGKRARAAEGRITVGMGPHGILGYTYNRQEKSLDLNEDQARTVRRIFQEAADRRPVRAIVRDLGKDSVPTLTGAAWARSTVRRILNNPTYRGELVYGRHRRVGTRHQARAEAEWIRKADAVPAIVTPELWQEAQNGLAIEKVSANPRSHYLLTGHARCGYCGAAISGISINRKYRYYRCTRQFHKADEMGPACKGKTVRADWAEELVWKAVSGVLADPVTVIREIKSRQTDVLPTLEAELADLKNRLLATRDREVRLVKLYEFGTIDDDTVKERSKGINTERARLQAQVTDTERQIASVRALAASMPALREVTAGIAGKLATADHEHKRLAMEALQIKVTVFTDHVDIAGAIPVESPQSQISRATSS